MAPNVPPWRQPIGPGRHHTPYRHRDRARLSPNRRVIIGPRSRRASLTCLLAVGHALLEAFPAWQDVVGRTWAKPSMRSARLQFTPHPDARRITALAACANTSTVRAPSSPPGRSCHLVLADEFNRATPKDPFRAPGSDANPRQPPGGDPCAAPEPFSPATQNPIKMRHLPLPESHWTASFQSDGPYLSPARRRGGSPLSHRRHVPHHRASPTVRRSRAMHFAAMCRRRARAALRVRIVRRTTPGSPRRAAE